jgi:hypothetical protein
VGTRVSLYEDAEGRLLLHRGGSPYLYVVADPAGGRFAADASEVATGEPERWDGDVLVVSALSADRWSEMTAQLVAWWEDGWVSGLAERGGTVEASAAARHYIGPPGPDASRERG